LHDGFFGLKFRACDNIVDRKVQGFIPACLCCPPFKPSARACGLIQAGRRRAASLSPSWNSQVWHDQMVLRMQRFFPWILVGNNPAGHQPHRTLAKIFFTAQIATCFFTMTFRRDFILSNKIGRF
jgi:hypothetical protein